MAGGRRAILHIGTAKTGTTSIQRFLSDHGDELPALGFAYARAPGKRNHIALAAFGAGEGYKGNAAMRAGAGGEDGASIGPRLAQDIAAEVAALPESVHSVVYSSEQLATRPDGPPDIARVKALFDPCFDDFLVVVYLRRQDDVAVSKYSSALRAGGETDADILPAADRGGGRLYDLEGIVTDWAAVFGKPAMRPRIFERATLLGGDVVRDFLATIGLDGLTPPPAPPSANAALKAEVQEFVRRFNAVAESSGLEHRPRLGRFVREPRFRGRPSMPPRAAAEEFLGRYAAANERLRAAYFPDRPQLFTPNFERYPERAEATDAEAVADSTLFGVAMDVLLVVAEELRQAEVELLARDARDAEATGDVADARRRWSKVLHEEETNAEARRAIKRLSGEAAVADGLALPTSPGRGERREAAKEAKRAGRKLAKRANVS